MPVRTAAQYMESLKDDRSIYIEGERIKDVTKDNRFVGAAETMAELLQMQHEKDLKEVLTYNSPTSGESVGMSHIQPKSKEDIKARGDAMKVWMDATCGMLGRSPDYKNVMVSAWAAAAKSFERETFDGSANIKNYYEYVRENDLMMTHVLVNPQVDRSRPAHLQESEIVAQIVKETDAGIIVRGARMVATLCALANEIIVMPAAVTWLTNEEHKTTNYAFGFAIPTSTPGLKFICRPPVGHLSAASPMDGPLSLRYDESDGVAVFETTKFATDADHDKGFVIGSNYYSSAHASYFIGFMDGIRYSKGMPRYTSGIPTDGQSPAKDYDDGRSSNVSSNTWSTSSTRRYYGINTHTYLQTTQYSTDANTMLLLRGDDSETANDGVNMYGENGFHLEFKEVGAGDERDYNNFNTGVAGLGSDTSATQEFADDATVFLLRSRPNQVNASTQFIDETNQTAPLSQFDSGSAGGSIHHNAAQNIFSVDANTANVSVSSGGSGTY